MDIYQKRIERKIKKIVLNVLKESELSKSNVVTVVKERGYHEYDIYEVINKLIDENYILETNNNLKLNKEELDMRNYIMLDLVANILELVFYIVGFVVKALIRLIP